MRSAALAFVLLFVPVLAQAEGRGLTFEVASVKPTAPGTRGGMIQFQPGGGLKTSNIPLLSLITFAYDVRDFQVAGAPSWASSEPYDIVARAERTDAIDSGPLDPRRLTDEQFKTIGDQIRERLRALLAERFQLKTHRETKEGSIYALVVAKSGSKLEVADESATGQRGMRMTRGQLSGMQAPMDLLTHALSSLLGRPVVDRTGLTGKYNYKLEWAPDSVQGGPKMPPGEEATAPPPESTGPSVFTAVQEQLGLRLESTKGPIEMIVVDHAERASEN